MKTVFGTSYHYKFITIAGVSHVVTKVDPFGEAIYDQWQETQSEPLIQRDGAESREHSTAKYLQEYTPETEHQGWLESHLEGPLLDLGAGAGRLSLYFQDLFETVAIDASEPLVTTMRERGVADARCVDILNLRDTFERDRFRSALAVGTQVALTGSMQGLRRFLGDLAFVTSVGATAAFMCYDPEERETATILGYRADPTLGLASRTMHFEYGDTIGRTLLFRLFSPTRLQEAAVGTGWEIKEIRRQSSNSASPYTVLLKKLD